MLSFTELRNISQAANHYSRSQIREGSTQLQNNIYSLDKKKALNQAVRDIRHVAMNDGQEQEFIDAITRFENTIAVSKKFSIGNCYEYALLALEYMVKNHPEVNAEVYYIKGGDHVFLVIDREKDSDPNHPETWGDTAFITDPWFNKVYPAKAYLKETKNFYSGYKDGIQTNYTQDFDPQRHILDPAPGQNSTEVLNGSLNLNSEILNYFKNINEKHCSIFDELATDLEKIEKKLTEKYDEKDPKVILVKNKIAAIRKETANIRQDVKECTQQLEKSLENKQYLSPKEKQFDTQKRIKNHLNSLRKTGSLSTEESDILHEYRNAGTFKTMVMKLVHKVTASSQAYQASINKTENKLAQAARILKF